MHVDSSTPAARARLPAPLACHIEHTLLRPEASHAQLTQLCEEARQHQFAGICVHSTALPLCRPLLVGTAVRLVTVIGFPLGAVSTAVKICEVTEARRLGAEELDMVLHLGALMAGDLAYVQADIAAVVAAAAPLPVKVIIETNLLTAAQIAQAAGLAAAAGAAYVKTCTGFDAGPGARVEDVRQLRALLPPAVQIKASGGIREAAGARALLAAGASRLGASASVALVTPARA